MENLEGEEYVMSPKKKKKKDAIARVLGADAKEVFHKKPQQTEETPLVPTSTIYSRSLKFIGFMILVFIWSIGLTTLMAIFLVWLESKTSHISEYMEAFCEGLSGGAFLSTVSGTMIFRIQQDFYGSEMDVSRSKTIGMSCFVFGIVFSNFIAMLENTNSHH